MQGWSKWKPGFYDRIWQSLAAKSLASSEVDEE
jgi:hypothetical protein